MNLNEVHGDVIQTARRLIGRSGVEVLLPHVCNNRGVMGAGVAAALAKTFPGVDSAYNSLCQSMEGDVLGRVVTEHVEPHLYVMNMIAQDGFNYGEVPLRYEALVRCMIDVRTLAHDHIELGAEAVIVAPRFGAGLAGGNWDFIKTLIIEMWCRHDLTVVISNFP
jgi:O-acetyl-ADP-ribose deacetylase (regulator of RNase III)